MTPRSRLTSAPQGRVRIIGGRWRGRRLPVAQAHGLRPTPDRVRETLFNWLQPQLPGAHCLDLFAGTGVLGFEALSRGAGGVVMVENNPQVAGVLRATAELLEAESLEVVLADARQWLPGRRQRFDVVFLDPPYGGSLLEPSCARLIEAGLLNPGARVYLETAPDAMLSLPPQLEKIRQGRAGQVQYGLLKYHENHNA